MKVMRSVRSMWVVALMSAAPAAAQVQNQTVNPGVREMALRLVTREQVLPTVRDGAGNSTQASVEPKFVLVGSTTGGVTGKARIGWIPHNNILVDGILSGPLSDGEVQFASLKGLGSSVSLQLRGQYAWKSTEARQAASRFDAERASRGGDASCAAPIDDIDKAICLAATRTAERLMAETLGLSPAGRDATASMRDRDAIRDAILTQASASVGAGLQNPVTRGTGYAFAVDELQDAFGREWRRLLRNGDVQTATSALISGSMLTSNQRFSFVNASTLESQREDRTGRSVELGIGVAKTRASHPLFYVGGGYEWGTAYKGQQKADICQPFVASSLRCQSVSIGGPTETDVNSVSVEGRAWLLSSKLAISARFLRDMEGDTNTVEFPVYFLRNVKDIEADVSADSAPALTGGLTAGWQGKPPQRDFYVYFFVGTVLGIPGLR